MRDLAETGVGARLNLGCGEDVRAGYLNIDLRQTHPNVIVADLSKYPWPFADRSAKEVLMLDFLEHFPYANTPFILLECYRILDDDGVVVIQVPDAVHLTRALIQDGEYLCNSCGREMFYTDMDGDRIPEMGMSECQGCGQESDDISEAAMRRLYGGQDYPGNFHQTCFTKNMLVNKAKAAGLVLLGYDEEDHQWANWNFKARFKKGLIW